MYAFTYHAPKTVRQAASALAKSDEAKLLAGGQTLLPTMKQRLASPSALIDLGKVEGLSGIELKGRSLVIGAMTRHAEVATSAVVQQAIPGLAALAERHRRPRRAQPRHHRRLDRQQRPRRRLPGRRPGAGRDHRHQQAQDPGRRSSSPACSTRRSTRARSS